MRESVNEVFEHIRKLSRCGVHFVSYTEEHFRTDGPAGAFLIPIAAWILQRERTLISERTRAALARARGQGKRLGRPRKVFPFEEVAADLHSGMSWRQLEQKYGIPQSTLRDATPSLREAAVPLDADDAPQMCTQEALQ